MAGQVLATPGVQITPAPSQVALPTNYITDFNFLNQYLPDTYSEEFERYGNRSIASFLRLVGAEYPTNSDLVKWTEQGRLHTIYQDLTTDSDDGPVGSTESTFVTAGGVMTFRVNQTVLISDNTLSISGKAIISAVDSAANTFTVKWYEATGQPAGMNASTAISAFVYGSEFKKGSAGMVGALEAEPEFFSNKPIIIKDHYEVSGSDMAQIGWVNVSDESGADGFYWYLQSAGETRTRFEDYMEMGMIEGVKAANGSGAETYLTEGTVGAGENAGTEGLFEAIETGGNVWSAGNPEVISDWDSILKRLDKQGSIKENVIFNNRDMSIDIDDMLAAQNSYGSDGTSFGMFSNSEQMALNLGFDGFSRGSYDFYKTDWKYLNDATLRGGITGGKVNGVMVPAGEKSVYDQMLGKNVTRPFLHCRYRSSPTEDRRYRTYVLGGAGGAATNNIDAMNIEFLTERVLCTMGRNNFFIFEG